MDSTISVIVSGIVAIGSLISSTFIAIYNAKYQLKVKKFEIITTDKEEAFKNYIMILSRLFHDMIRQKIMKENTYILFDWHIEYVKSLSMVMLFANDESKEAITEFNKFMGDWLIEIGTKDYEALYKKYETLVDEYNKDVGKYENHFLNITEVLSKDLKTIEDINFSKNSQ